MQNAPIVRIVRLVFGWLVRRFLAVGVAIAATVAGWQIAQTDWGRSEESAALQHRQAARKPVALTKDIVIVYMTANDTFALDGVPGKVSVARHHHAELIQGLRRAHARSLTFDLTFDDTPQPAEDRPFLSAVQSSDPMAITFVMDHSAGNEADEARNGFRYYFHRPAFLSGKLPAGVEFGQSEVTPTGTEIREIPLLCKDEKSGGEVQNVALIAFRHVFGIPADRVRFDQVSELTVYHNTFQVGPDVDFLINWGNGKQNFEVIPYSRALTMLGSERSREFFKDKTVFVGAENDTPQETAAGLLHGTWIVANALNTLLLKDSLIPVRIDQDVERAWSFCLALLVALSLAARSPWIRAAVSAGALGLAFFSPLLVLSSWNYSVAIVFPVASALVAGSVGLAVRGLFPRTYPIRSSATLEATVLMVDLKGSTPLVEKVGPEKARAIIGDLLAQAFRIVAAAGGEVVRETGDGLLAFFRDGGDGAHASVCLGAALEIQEMAQRASVRYGHPLRFTFGVESGPINQDHLTIHGLTVNTAARLEATCDQEGAAILVGPVAFGLARHRIGLRRHGRLELKGIENEIDVYTVSFPV